MSVTILGQEGDYTSGDDGASVTKIRYTASVLDADSSIANVDEPSQEVYDTELAKAGFTVCGCIPDKIREFYISGPVDGTDDETLQDAIAKAWKKENPDFNGTLTTTIISKTNGYQSSDENGTKLTKVTYKESKI
ncbi:uncharacterized protein LOC135470607 [Liolophura sinensis]|uniref:uncharacterized protein LOC135470607 n=1 Tax=Liolophura sinensis TaxID=3198878 RepID=UPI0031596FBA